MNKQTLRFGTEIEKGSVPDWLAEAFDSIDSGVFSGDSFENKDALAYFDYFVSRWQRELMNARVQVDLETSAEQSVAALASGEEPALHAVFVERKGTFMYFLAVFDSDASAREAAQAYESFNEPAAKPLYYIPCSSYVAPGYYNGQLISVVNRDEEKPEIKIPVDEVVEGLENTHDDSRFYGVIFQNHESESLALAVYPMRFQADEFYRLNKHRPAVMTQTVQPLRRADVVFLGNDVRRFPSEFKGKPIEVINAGDVISAL